MNISNYYWYFSGVLTPKFCDEVIQYANAQKEEMARTGGYGDRKLNKQEVLDLKRKRNSDLVWLNDSWIYKEIHPYVHMDVILYISKYHLTTLNLIFFSFVNF